MTRVRIEVGDDGLRRWVTEAVAEAGARETTGAPDLHVVDTAVLGESHRATRAPHPLVVVCASLAEPGIGAADGCDHVVALPAGMEWLVRLLRWAGSASVHRPTVPVAVVGARGGAGASTLAAGLAAAHPGPAVVVDADPAGPGIDLAAGMDDATGIRWTDLVDIRGRIPESALAGRLPHAGSLDWLATPPGTPNAASWRPVVESLVAAFRGVVLDLPRFRLTATPPPPGCAVVVVTTLELMSLAGARSLLESGRVGQDPVMAVRPIGGPLRMSTAEQMLPGSRLVELPDSRSVRGSADFGDLADAVVRGAYGRACAALLAEVQR